MGMNLDTTKVRPIPLQATLVLVNNFIINTTKFLNSFSESCEIKIAKVSEKLNDLEVVLSVLEAKLNSIPGLESQPSGNTEEAKEVHVPDVPDSHISNPAPDIAQPAVAPPANVRNNNTIKASEHPDYGEFFRLIRLGVPAPVVQAKVRSAGLDPSVLDTPDAELPIGGSGVPLSRRIFNKYDSGGSGCIGVKQFQRMAADHGVWLSGEALDLAIKMIDHDGNNTIEYSEFLKWYQQSSFSSLSLDDDTLERRHQAATLFAKYDDDKSGVIDRSEFVGLHAELKLSGLTQHSVEKALEDMDMDMDGSIQFNEFVLWLERH